MGPTLEPSTTYVQRKLLITAIEDKAKWMPNDTYMRYPRKNWETEGYETMSWIQYAGSIDKVAYWLDEKLGRTVDNDTIAYFGPNDPRYAIMFAATIKTGRKILIPDGRMSSERLKGLIDSTDCKAWVYAEDDARGPLVGEDAEMRTIALPPLHCLNEMETKRYPYSKTFEQAAHDPIVIVHTSGTTGMPKPVVINNGGWSARGSGMLLSQRHWPRGIAHESWIGKRALSCCVPQWLGGLNSMITSPVFMNSPSVMLPPDVGALSPELFKKLVRLNLIEGLKCPPQTIVTLYEDLEAREILKSLRFIMYLGATLDRAIGDDLCQYTIITPFIGSTETGDQMSFRPMDRKLWYTHDFVPELGGKMIRVNSTGEDASDLYEYVLDRPKTDEEGMFQPAFWNPAFRGLNRIETKELYRPIVDLDGRTRWIFSARKDDLTKLSWLVKFSAQDIEERILKHKDVRSVCVGGEGRSAPYVIVETKEGVLENKNKHEILEDLYQNVIASTNDANFAEIRIPKETVLIADKQKPFKRNLKQVVMRKEVEQDYHREIEQAYLNLKKAGASRVL